MDYILCAVRDNAVEAFQALNTVRAKGEAVRAFIDAINDPNNRQLNQHPEDFDLYLVGYYDDQTGRPKPLEQPERLLRGIDAKKTTA